MNLFTTIILISDYTLPDDLTLEMYAGGLGKEEEEEPDRPDFGMSPREFRSLWQGMVSSRVNKAKLLHFMNIRKL